MAKLRELVCVGEKSCYGFCLVSDLDKTTRWASKVPTATIPLYNMSCLKLSDETDTKETETGLNMQRHRIARVLHTLDHFVPTDEVASSSVSSTPCS